MSQLTTHVLDTAIGKPAEGVPVTLEHLHGTEWIQIAEGITDSNGRISSLLPGENFLADGTYRLVFATEVYFRMRTQTVFYPQVKVEFIINDKAHYHIPLLLSPYGYSTYRGS